MTRRLDRDLMHMAQPKDVATASLGTLDRLQDYPPHVQALASGYVFLSIAEAYGIPAQDVFTAVTNIVNDKDGKKRPEFAGVRSYVEHEL